MRWVRTAQPGGGHSKWHLLVERRIGLVHPRSTTVDEPFIVTACGYALTGPTEDQIGQGASHYRPGVALPLDGRGQPVKDYGSVLCERCADLAYALVNSRCA